MHLWSVEVNVTAFVCIYAKVSLDVQTLLVNASLSNMCYFDEVNIYKTIFISYVIHDIVWYLPMNLNLLKFNFKPVQTTNIDRNRDHIHCDV